MIESIHRYPRTHHLEGSRLQPRSVAGGAVRASWIVLRDRGEAGRCERRDRARKHWDLFKRWAHAHEAALVARIPAGTGVVLGRYKWIRASFLTSVIDSGGHWLDRPIVPNRLADGVELFAGRP